MKFLHRKSSLTRSQRGQSLVELAISLTVMLLLLAGAVTFGMALFSYVAIRDAAQEGALWGSFNPFVDTGTAGWDGEAVDEAGIRARVRAASTSPVNLGSAAVVPDAYISVDVTPTGGKPCEGVTGSTPNGVHVQVEYDYPIIMPYIGGIINSQHIHLRAEVTDTILEPRCPSP